MHSIHYVMYTVQCTSLTRYPSKPFDTNDGAIDDGVYLCRVVMNYTV